MILSVAEEANAPSAGGNRAYSNGRSGENKYSGCQGAGTEYRGFPKKRPLCDGGRQRGKTVILAEVLGTWPIIAGIGEGEGNGRKEGGNIVEKKKLV